MSASNRDQREMISKEKKKANFNRRIKAREHKDIMEEIQESGSTRKIYIYISSINL